MKLVLLLVVALLIGLSSCKTSQQRATKHFNKACALNPDICKKSIKDSVRIKDSTRINIKDSITIIKAGQAGIDGHAPCDSTEQIYRGGSGNFTYLLKFFKGGRFSLDIKEVQDTKSQIKESNKESIKEKDKIKETITPPVIVEKKLSWLEKLKAKTDFFWWLGLALIALSLYKVGLFTYKKLSPIK